MSMGHAVHAAEPSQCGVEKILVVNIMVGFM